MHPFRAFTAFSDQPTIKQLNNSTTQQLNAPKGLARMGTRAESPTYFSPIPQGWGIDSHTPLGGLKA
ncbi:hypothetical protein CLI85_12030 [Tannerella forsythia]|nr:hypothetical protein CLI85_12030 [Tannerella forsythia]